MAQPSQQQQQPQSTRSTNSVSSASLKMSRAVSSSQYSAMTATPRKKSGKPKALVPEKSSSLKQSFPSSLGLNGTTNKTRSDPLDVFFSGQHKLRGGSNGDSQSVASSGSRSTASEMSRGAQSTGSGFKSPSKRRKKSSPRRKKPSVASAGALKLGLFLDQQQEQQSQPHEDLEVRSAYTSPDQTARKKHSSSSRSKQHKEKTKTDLLDFAQKTLRTPSGDSVVGKPSRPKPPISPTKTPSNNAKAKASTLRDLTSTPSSPNKKVNPRTARSRSPSPMQRRSHPSTVSSNTSSTSTTNTTPPSSPRPSNPWSTTSTTTATARSVSPVPSPLVPAIHRRMSNPTVQEFTARRLHQGGTPIMAMVTHGKHTTTTTKAAAKAAVPTTTGDASAGSKPSTTTKSSLHPPRTKKKKSLGKKSSYSSSSRSSAIPPSVSETSEFTNPLEPTPPLASSSSSSSSSSSLLHSEWHDVFSFYSWSSSSSTSGHRPLYHSTTTRTPPETLSMTRTNLQLTLRNNPLHKALANMEVA